LMPRRDRARRQRRPRPDDDPEREDPQRRGQAGHERRWGHAGVQGPADDEADHRRRDLRNAEDHEQEQVMRRAPIVALPLVLLAILASSASATTAPSLIV